ncbi:16S rRNA (guanine(966)-N(2))-methyltransferase RsmD [Rhizobium rhizosphaerae]|uniref:16S rRNA (Guanine(966)-N(2))-methyltransferase RsmD n=1 Tax=Xaviernesmea rhizosphaerae TaxID=1672749 RepID=A0A1Q9AH77_9HYPH|nr:16S rRNA (guanine(966)-N(2))-methyltransferase RsmD [Xaviernesmea rhizosphaerae]OLP54540.1 16S rRNA (guanine(966)-N(2))-methyltransferase RsmD [Xaviernesmea rhizosphaerae]
MRIVGGTFRGRALEGPKTDTIRPTSDRTRESLFNILAHAYSEAIDGTRMLELFAGTGAVGLEAISRGCRYAHFVELSAEGRGLLRTNIEALGLTGHTRIYRRDATDLGPIGTLEPFDFVFADPPYGQGLGEKALTAALKGNWLVDGALAILEERADVLPMLPEAFAPIEVRIFGDTRMHFYRFRKQAP